MLELGAKGVVWDLDGTLLDSVGLHDSVLTEVLRQRHMPVPPQDVFTRNHHGALRDSIQAICGADGSLLDEIYEQFIQSEEHHYRHPEALYFPDAIDLLERNHAAGLKQIVVSNRPHHSDGRLGSPRNLAKRAPLAGHIETVVCGDDNEFRKPDARLLDEAELRLGLKRNELLVIGDQFVDAELAHNLGAVAVLVERRGESIPHLEQLRDGWRERTYLVQDLRDVLILPV